jgi:hypothetical protein
VEAHDARLSEVEREGAERAREWREQRNELQAKVETLKDACEGEGGHWSAQAHCMLGTCSRTKTSLV